MLQGTGFLFYPTPAPKLEEGVLSELGFLGLEDLRI
jgi:hypothetical protein